MMNQAEAIILQALEDSGKSYAMTRKSFVVDCPSCGKEEKCYILKSSGRSICWVCSTRWSAKGIVSAILGVSTAEAETRLFGYSGGPKNFLKLPLSMDSNSSDELSDEDFEDTDIPVGRPFYFDPTFVDLWKGNPVGMEYCVKRGVDDPAVWVRQGLKYHAGMNAVVVPVAVNGVIYGYQARYIAPKDPKIRMHTSQDLPRDRVLMGHDVAASRGAVIIVEGIFDMLRTDLPQLDLGSVATMGKIVTQGQVDLLKKLPAKKIFIGLDRDAYDLVPELAHALVAGGKEVYRIFPPEHRDDFGECDQNEISSAIGAAEFCSGSKLARLEVFLM